MVAFITAGHFSLFSREAGGVGPHAAVSRLTPMPSIRSRTMRGAGTWPAL